MEVMNQIARERHAAGATFGLYLGQPHFVVRRLVVRTRFTRSKHESGMLASDKLGALLKDLRA